MYTVDDGAADDGGVNVAFGLVVLVIISQEFQHGLISYFENSLVLMCIQTLFEKYNSVFVTITYKAFVFLTKLPLFTGISLKILLFRMFVITWILVPNQLWIILFPCNNKIVDLTVVISTNSIAFF